MSKSNILINIFNQAYAVKLQKMNTRPKILNCYSKWSKIILFLSLVNITYGCEAQEKNDQNLNLKSYEITKSDEEWKKQLSTEEYHILREKGTEEAFTGKFNKHDEKGTYLCAACKNEVFLSEAKYNSFSGWPSFYKPVSGNVEIVKDYSYGMVRDEVVCARCGSHLGHVFSDGPEPTGLRYCINSVALDFRKDL